MEKSKKNVRILLFFLVKGAKVRIMKKGKSSLSFMMMKVHREK